MVPPVGQIHLPKNHLPEQGWGNRFFVSPNFDFWDGILDFLDSCGVVSVGVSQQNMARFQPLIVERRKPALRIEWVDQHDDAVRSVYEGAVHVGEWPHLGDPNLNPIFTDGFVELSLSEHGRCGEAFLPHQNDGFDN
uniref:Uncharacterized protein n=1 Tax=uncultured marine group II/III euryarchaeote KM3_13_G01 TaxID=1457873 RepID=A0A075GB77_9EURY|nr:hypothetical protein [uncultured marine group II/III euryarchaeote KM3_13_G01]